MTSSYRIGQLRRSEIDSYSTDIDFSQGLIVNEEAVEDFYDPCLTLSGSNKVDATSTYYLQFTVKQLASYSQDISIILKNNEADLDNTQTVRSFSVKQGIDSTTFEIIFCPNSTYDEIIFQLTRMAADFYLDNGDGTSGRIIDLTIDNFYKLNNVITTLSSMFDDLSTLTKIGIQGPPGLMFTINGEELRIGRTGIYELYNEDVIISYIGFVIKDSLMTQDGKDFFIMDFKY